MYTKFIFQADNMSKWHALNELCRIWTGILVTLSRRKNSKVQGKVFVVSVLLSSDNFAVEKKRCLKFRVLSWFYFILYLFCYKCTIKITAENRMWFIEHYLERNLLDLSAVKFLTMDLSSSYINAQLTALFKVIIILKIFLKFAF